MPSTACVYRAAATSSPKNSSWPGGGTPKQNPPAPPGAASSPERGARENPSSASNPRAALHTVCASSQVSDRIETQSNVRQAGTTPCALSTPRVGLSPTNPLKAAGTRPEPAVSVPRAKLARPEARSEEHTSELQ